MDRGFGSPAHRIPTLVPLLNQEKGSKKGPTNQLLDIAGPWFTGFSPPQIRRSSLIAKQRGSFIAHTMCLMSSKCVGLGQCHTSMSTSLPHIWTAIEAEVECGCMTNFRIPRTVTTESALAIWWGSASFDRKRQLRPHTHKIGRWIWYIVICSVRIDQSPFFPWPGGLTTIPDSLLTQPG